ncbi:MAG: SRPBCC family protein [Gemmatimonadaceae bacterium]
MAAEFIRSADLVVTAARTIVAPAGAIFAAWTDAATLKRVFGLSRAELDVRLGGRYRFETDGTDEFPGRHVVTGEYRELVPRRRIVQSWIYEGPMTPGEVIETLVTVELREIMPDVVQVTLREEGPTFADAGQRAFALAAWTMALRDLELTLFDRAA